MALGGDLLSGAGAAYGLNDLYGRINDQQDKVDGKILSLANTVQQNTDFQPYGVTSAVGTSTVGPDGLSMGLSDQGKLYQDSLFNLGGGLVNASAQDPLERQNQLYNTMAASQSPEQERQRALMNQRLQASGRSGMMSNTYGGTPEQLAFEKALQEQQSANWLQSGQFAQQELDSQYQRGSGMLGLAWTPQEMLQRNAELGLKGANERNAVGIERAGMLSQLGLGGLEADINYDNIKGNLLGSAYAGLTGNNGLFQSIGDSIGGIDWGNIFGGGGQDPSPYGSQPNGGLIPDYNWNS